MQLRLDTLMSNSIDKTYYTIVQLSQQIVDRILPPSEMLQVYFSATQNISEKMSAVLFIQFD